MVFCGVIFCRLWVYVFVFFLVFLWLLWFVCVVVVLGFLVVLVEFILKFGLIEGVLDFVWVGEYIGEFLSGEFRGDSFVFLFFVMVFEVVFNFFNLLCSIMLMLKLGWLIWLRCFMVLMDFGDDWDVFDVLLLSWVMVGFMDFFKFFEVWCIELVVIVEGVCLFRL